MNITTVLIGIAGILFGLYTAWTRVKMPEQLKKLEPMKKMWGERAGVIVHFIGYTLIPVLFGIVTSLKGFNGGSFF